LFFAADCLKNPNLTWKTERNHDPALRCTFGRRLNTSYCPNGMAGLCLRALIRRARTANLADQVGRLSCRLRGVLGHDSPQLEGQGLLPRLLLAQKKLCMSAETYLFLSGQVLTGQDENGKIGGS